MENVKIDRKEKAEAIQFAKGRISNTCLACICPTLKDFFRREKGYSVNHDNLANLFPTLADASPFRGYCHDIMGYPFFNRDKKGQQMRLLLLDRIEQNDL